MMGLLLLLLALQGIARGAALQAVRPFTTAGQARVLLVLDSPQEQGEIRTRASPPVGGIAARGIAWVDGLVPGPELPVELPVGADGLRRILVASVGTGLQITVEMEEARTVKATRLHPRGLVIDLAPEGAVPALGLPSDAQLLAIVQGIDLVRQSGTPPSQRRVIVLDAGHGGFDHGAVGVTGAREADIALQLVLRTARLVEQQAGAEVILTRDHDVFVPLTERARIANAAGADLFLSIHANAAPGPEAWGIETYSMDTASDAGAARVEARENAIAAEEGLDPTQDLLAAQLITAGTLRLSKELAAQVQSGVCQRLRQSYGDDSVRDLGTKTALFTVLTRTRMPAILFESSFVSHRQDERRLRAPHYQQTMAQAIATAVASWLQRQGRAGEGGPLPSAAAGGVR